MGFGFQLSRFPLNWGKKQPSLQELGEGKRDLHTDQVLLCSLHTMFELNAFAGLVVSILCTSTAYIILIESSQTEDGQFKYSFVLVLLLTSLVKLVLSASALYYDTYVNNPEVRS